MPTFAEAICQTPIEFNGTKIPMNSVLEFVSKDYIDQTLGSNGQKELNFLQFIELISDKERNSKKTKKFVGQLIEYGLFISYTQQLYQIDATGEVTVKIGSRSFKMFREGVVTYISIKEIKQLLGIQTDMMIEDLKSKKIIYQIPVVNKQKMITEWDFISIIRN
ncbi:MAG: hypothetical protein AAGF26_18730, partial [Cyanobacteria bacterium P01_G01_bin.49]